MTEVANDPHIADDAADMQKQVGDKLAAFELATLRILALVVAFVFTVRVITSFLLFSINEALVITSIVSTSLLLSFGILIAHWRNSLRPSLVRPLTTLLVTLVTFNVFYILHVTGNLNQFFFASLILVAFGLGASTFSMWLIFVVPFTIVFLSSLFVLEIGYMAPYIAVLVGGMAISAVAFFVRVPAIRKLIELEVMQSHNARKLALSNKAKDQFLANMTHELRTPLTGVIGMIDLMRGTELTGEQRHYLNTAHHSARYLLTVINDILDMSKLEAGKLVINNAPLDAIALSRNVASLFEVRIAQKNLSLSLQLPDEKKLPVKGDSVRISQILLNLLENALKFTDSGSITIILDAKKAVDETTLTWTVRDTGKGIEQERLPKLFDRFEQVDSSVTRGTQGTGLGLAIIRDLVQLMKGDVGARSEVGKGSEFWFELSLPTASLADLSGSAPVPLSDMFLSLKSSEASISSTGKEEPPELPEAAETGIRILFAEDNPVNRELIARLINRQGWTGTAVCNGQEAVEAVKANGSDYDLILMDIQMPVMDGLSAYKIIKRDQAFPPPIVALTANTLPEDRRQYEEAGFDAIIGKPIDVTAFRSTVERLTTTRRHG